MLDQVHDLVEAILVAGEWSLQTQQPVFVFVNEVVGWFAYSPGAKFGCICMLVIHVEPT